MRAGIGGQGPPVGQRPLEGLALRRRTAALRCSRRWSRPARSCRPGRRPRSTCCRPSCGRPCRARGWPAGIFDHVAGAAGGADLADDRQDDVLGGAADGERRRRPRPACSSAGFCSSVWVASTCSTSEVPMPKASAPKAPCVLVWLSPQTMVVPGRVKPSSGPMTCTMPCACRPAAGTGHAELGDVLLQRLDLQPAFVIGDAGLRSLGRHVVVEHRQGRVRPAHLAAGEPQALEGLRAGHLVDEVAVDVEDAGAVRRARSTTWRPRSCRTACAASALTLFLSLPIAAPRALPARGAGGYGWRRRPRLRRTSRALLDDARRLAGAAAQVIQLRPAHLAAAHAPRSRRPAASRAGTRARRPRHRRSCGR